MPNIWHPDDKAGALRLWSEGLSGTKVGLRFGKSRNSIIGLAHRNGLANDPKRPTSKFASAVGRARTRALKPKPLVRPKIVAPKPKRERKMNVPIVRPIPEVIEHNPNPTPIHFADDSMCRHIAGEPKAGALVCGDKVVLGTSWCPFHRRLLYQETPSKRREPISTYRQYVVAA